MTQTYEVEVEVLTTRKVYVDADDIYEAQLLGVREVVALVGGNADDAEIVSITKVE